MTEFIEILTLIITGTGFAALGWVTARSTYSRSKDVDRSHQLLEEISQQISNLKSYETTPPLSVEDILKVIDFRSEQIQKILSDDKLLKAVERNLLLETALWGEIGKMHESINQNATEENIENYAVQLGVLEASVNRVISGVTWGAKKFGEKAIDKLVGILNGMLGIPGSSNKSNQEG